MIWSLLFLNGISCGPWQNYLAPFLWDELSYSVEFTGRLWSIIGFLGLWSGVAIGVLADRIGIRCAMVLSYLLLGAAGLLVAMHSSDVVLLCAAVAFGLAFFAVFGLVPSYITKTADAAQTTRIFGIANVMLGGGTTLGNFLGGVSQSYFETFFWVYVSVVVTALIAILVSWALPSEHASTQKPAVGYEMAG